MRPTVCCLRQTHLTGVDAIYGKWAETQRYSTWTEGLQRAGETTVRQNRLEANTLSKYIIQQRQRGQFREKAINNYKDIHMYRANIGYWQLQRKKWVLIQYQVRLSIFMLIHRPFSYKSIKKTLHSIHGLIMYVLVSAWDVFQDLWNVTTRHSLIIG